jgi:hypothetical protein
LAHQVGCTAAHISNFLNRRRRLSIDTLDKVLKTQFLAMEDLMLDGRYSQLTDGRAGTGMGLESVPLVEPWIAAFSARVPSAAILDVVKVESKFLGDLRDRCSAERRRWDRFVAIQMWEEEAALMQPLLPASAIVLIDRHYNSTFRYAPGRNTVYAVRVSNRLRFRYVTLLDRQLVMHAHNPAHVPELVALSQERSSADTLVGRVFRVISDP